MKTILSNVVKPTLPHRAGMQRPQAVRSIAVGNHRYGITADGSLAEIS